MCIDTLSGDRYGLTWLSLLMVLHACTIHCRREVLKTWMNKMMLDATYGNLLKVFVEAGHSDCAKKLFDLLEEKGEASISWCMC